MRWWRHKNPPINFGCCWLPTKRQIDHFIAAVLSYINPLPSLDHVSVYVFHFFVGQKTAKRLSIFESSCYLPPSPPHKMEVLHDWTSNRSISREANLGILVFSFWFGMTERWIVKNSKEDEFILKNDSCITKNYKNWSSQLPCLTFSIKRDSVKPQPCVVDRWAGGSWTRRPKGPSAVPWQGKFVNNMQIKIQSIKIFWGPNKKILQAYGASWRLFNLWV